MHYLCDGQYLYETSSHAPSRDSDAAVPASPLPLAVPKRKVASVVTAHPERRSVAKRFSEGEYRLLQRRYKPLVQTAHGTLNTQGLKVLARATKGLMLAESTPTGLRPGHSLWPAAKDVIYGNTSALEHKLSAGLSPDATMLMSSPRDTYVTLLDLAIEAGQRDVIRLLLSLNASVDPIYTNYQSGAPKRSEGPLPLAAMNDENDVIRLLLERGANVNQRFGGAWNNHTALAEAATLGDPSTVYLLLTHGANVDSVLEPDGMLPFDLTFHPQPRLVAVRKLLVQYGLKMPPGH